MAVGPAASVSEVRVEPGAIAACLYGDPVYTRMMNGPMTRALRLVGAEDSDVKNGSEKTRLPQAPARYWVYYIKSDPKEKSSWHVEFNIF